MSSLYFESIRNEFMNTPESLYLAGPGESSPPSSSSEEVKSPDHPLGNIADVESDKTETIDKEEQKRRHKYTEEELLHLQYLYSINKFISQADRIVVAAIFGLTERQITVWFQNRRQKDKIQREKEKNSSNQRKLIAEGDGNTSAGYGQTVHQHQHHHQPQNGYKSNYYSFSSTSETNNSQNNYVSYSQPAVMYRDEYDYTTPVPLNELTDAYAVNLMDYVLQSYE